MIIYIYFIIYKNRIVSPNDPFFANFSRKFFKTLNNNIFFRHFGFNLFIVRVNCKLKIIIILLLTFQVYSNIGAGFFVQNTINSVSSGDIIPPC